MHRIFFLLFLNVAKLAFAELVVLEQNLVERMERAAKSTLAINLTQIGDQVYLVAGQHQFKTLWFRDFAFASRGLFADRKGEVVQKQLELFLKNRRSLDHLIPKTFDSRSPQRRVAYAVFCHFSHMCSGTLSIEDPVKPHFLDENGSEAIDSNVLFLHTALNLIEYYQNTTWWQRHDKELQEVFEFYKKYLVDGLIKQKPHADWQDSVQRPGYTFYMNLLYSYLLERLAQHHFWNISQAEAEDFKLRVKKAFYDPSSGLYFSVKGFPQISLDGHLLALDLGWIEPLSKEGRSLYQNLKKHPLYTTAVNHVMGFNTYPDYPDDWPSVYVKAAGLKNYHDKIYWSWLMALAIKVSLVQKDYAYAVNALVEFDKAVQRDLTIAEIYEPNNRFPLWSSVGYYSEYPFSWGAGFTLDMIYRVKKEYSHLVEFNKSK